MASRLLRLAPALWSFILAAIILGPLAAPGYLLLRDAVSTPRSYLTDAALGVSDAAPRAVPQDAIVAIASMVVDGGIVVKLLLFAALWAAGCGAAAMVRRLLPDVGVPAQCVATTVAIWNPYVAERLLQGHWSLLIGYAALPWAVVAAEELRSRRSWWRMALVLSCAAITPTGAVLAALVALLLVAVPGGVSRGVRFVGTLVIAVAASAPWLIATAVTGSGAASDPSGVAAFAARAEPGLGTIGSLAGLGGIWNADAVPDSRTTLFAVVGTTLLLAVVLVGAPVLVRVRSTPVTVLAAVGVLAIVIIALAATPWGLSAGRWAAVNIPGAGLTRDAQKLVALAMPVFALSAAAGAARWRRAWPSAAVTVAIVMLALPDLAWGVGGALRPVQYPAALNAVNADLTTGSGDVAVLPGGIFRRFDWSGDAPVLDPAPRLLDANVLGTGELPVSGGVVRGEGARASRVEAVLLQGGSASDLATLGVGWVLLEHRTPGPLGDSAETLDALDVVQDSADLTLYRVPDPVVVEPDSMTRAAVVGGHLLWLIVLLLGFVGAGLALAGAKSTKP